MSEQASEIGFPTPAHRVVAALGGVKATAALAGASVKSVYRWLQPVAQGGGGGLVPVPAQRRMVQAALVAGRKLDFADFSPTADEAVL